MGSACARRGGPAGLAATAGPELRENLGGEGGGGGRDWGRRSQPCREHSLPSKGTHASRDEVHVGPKCAGYCEKVNRFTGFQGSGSMQSVSCGRQSLSISRTHRDPFTGLFLHHVQGRRRGSSHCIDTGYFTDNGQY